MKPVLVDLFCKAGGCTAGYQRAGFYVIGVDVEPQPRYVGDEFVQGDALDVAGRGEGEARRLPVRPVRTRVATSRQEPGPEGLSSMQVAVLERSAEDAQGVGCEVNPRSRPATTDRLRKQPVLLPGDEHHQEQQHHEGDDNLHDSSFLARGWERSQEALAVGGGASWDRRALGGDPLPPALSGRRGREAGAAVTSHSAFCECGWQVGPWRGRLGSWLVGRLFHHHLTKGCR